MNENLAYLRADFSQNLGLGHLSRALSVASALERGGIRPIVLSRNLGGEHRKTDRFQSVRWLKEESEFVSILQQEQGKYLFMDLVAGPDYACLPPLLQNCFSEYRTVCFDSFFDDVFNFDLYIGPSFDGTTTRPNSLSGLQYYVFSEDLRKLALAKPSLTNVHKVLVSLGGSDPFNATPAVLSDLCGAYSNLEFTAVIGPGFSLSAREKVSKLASLYKNLKCAIEPIHLGNLYLENDFAIISGGQTKFEAALFGLPSLIFANSKEEAHLSKRFSDWGASEFIGSAESALECDLRTRFDSLILDEKMLLDMSTRGRQMLDGKGGERIVAFIKKNLS